MDGISGVMDLAAASGEDLALVADIVTDGLTAFGMEAKDSARMADVLAAASANANTDVNGLGQAFSYVAPVAGALGYTMEDTSKAIGLMANSGIKSTKAGTALRTMMTNLSKPTASAQKEMEKLGISITDTDGNMKDFDSVMRDLRKSFNGLTEEQQAQAAATIFGKEAMSGALSIINASEADFNKLGDAIKNSEGSAKEMADTMQDNFQGSLKELKSMIEDLFIELYQNLKPALESVVESLKNATQWFANLSPKTQENIVKFGALAAATGPVLSIMGKLTSTVGGLMQGTGALVKAIGLSKGAGLLGSLAGLGPAGVAGLAVAGIGAVGYAVYKLTQDKEELNEVSLDTAESLLEQSESLKKSADAFDNLSNKAKVSNDELAELHSLNKRIESETNPAVINELQQRYDELAKKSGLSKDELEKLFKANDDIIQQSPNVEKSIDNQGNAFARNTDAVRDYISTLEEMTLIELSAERTKALENQAKLEKERNNLLEERKGLHDELSQIEEFSKMTNEELNEIFKANAEEIKNVGANTERYNELSKEQELIQAVLNDEIGKQIERLQEKLDKNKESLDLTDAELEKIQALENEMGNLVLKQQGINEEGEEGLRVLDERIAKNDEELAKLDEKLEKNGKLTQEEQERYDKLTEVNQKHREARDMLHDELGLYESINSLANNKLDKVDKTTQKKIEELAATIDIDKAEKDIIASIDKKTDKTKKQRDELIKSLEAEGKSKKEIDKQTASLDKKIGKNAEVKKQILEELGVWKNLDDKIKDGINSEIKKGKQVDETTNKQKNQGNQIDANNKKTDEGIKKEQQRTKEAGTDVNKNVNAKDNGTIADINKRAREVQTKFVDLKERGLASLNKRISSPVKKVVNLVARGASKLKFWAKGTPPSGHPGGHAILGDGTGLNAGSELVTLPSGKQFLSASTPTIYPSLPKGTHVLSAKETKRLLANTPRYAQGTSGVDELFNIDNLRQMELLSLLSLRDKNSSKTPSTPKEDKKLEKMISYLSQQVEDSKQVINLLTQLLLKDNDLYIDGRQLAQAVSKPLDDINNRNTINKVRARGGR